MAVTVNAVTTDALLVRRLSTYARRIDNLAIHCTKRPVSEEEADVYVVPIEQIGWLLDGTQRPRTWLPVVAYGGAEALGAAFFAGCSDYLREPWSAEELSFRTARVAHSGSFATAWGKVRLTEGLAATEYGEVELSIHEHRILRVLLMQLGRTVPRQALFYALWGRVGGGSRAVDVHVSSLRRKLAVIADPRQRNRIIRSARGLGYLIPGEQGRAVQRPGFC